MKEKCLQELTGSCIGCPILDMVVERVNKGQVLEDAANQISKQYCPLGAKPQDAPIKPIRVYTMGQTESTWVEIRP